MDINQVRTQIATAKANVLKGDITNSLKRFIYALHALVQGGVQIPTEIKTLIRDTATEYNSFKQIKDELGISFNYVAGEEKKLLVACMKAYEHLTKEEKEEESYEDALKRKKNLDAHLIAVKDFLSRNFLEQADEEVEKAMEYYKDEHKIFAYLGELYLQSNYITRAKHFFKQATEAEPNNQDVAKRFIEVNKMQAK